jgi:hypothetical protein
MPTFERSDRRSRAYSAHGKAIHQRVLRLRTALFAFQHLATITVDEQEADKLRALVRLDRSKAGPILEDWLRSQTRARIMNRSLESAPASIHRASGFP